MIRRDKLIEWIPLMLGAGLLLMPFAKGWFEAPAIDESIILAPQTHIVREFHTRASFEYNIDLVFDRPWDMSPERYGCLLAGPQVGHECSHVSPELSFTWKLFEGGNVVASGNDKKWGFETESDDVFERVVGNFDAKRWTRYRLDINIRTAGTLSGSKAKLRVVVDPLYWKGDGLFVIIEWPLGILFVVIGLSLRRRNKRQLPPAFRNFQSGHVTTSSRTNDPDKDRR